MIPIIILMIILILCMYYKLKKCNSVVDVNEYYVDWLKENYQDNQESKTIEDTTKIIPNVLNPINNFDSSVFINTATNGVIANNAKTNCGW